mmetsp:Transcript_44798/g.103433  ORF Transcript_44798/g.103433 Transcript_44798/m.103433 type:complete len:203 (+) Transcript_44798:975-1583(+)
MESMDAQVARLMSNEQGGGGGVDMLDAETRAQVLAMEGGAPASSGGESGALGGAQLEDILQEVRARDELIKSGVEEVRARDELIAELRAQAEAARLQAEAAEREQRTLEDERSRAVWQSVREDDFRQIMEALDVTRQEKEDLQLQLSKARSDAAAAAAVQVQAAEWDNGATGSGSSGALDPPRRGLGFSLAGLPGLPSFAKK